MKICISIAERPGTFGSTFHNRGYQLLGLDYHYIPLKISPRSLGGIIQITKDNFHGCSVSMPHKVQVMQYLDSFDESAQKVKAVNTILNLGNGKLRGYNTDYYGAEKALYATETEFEGKTALILGAGGVARAIGHAIRNLGGIIIVANRTEEKGRELAEEFGGTCILWAERNQQQADIVINATTIGMNSQEMPLAKEAVSHFNLIMDVVVSNTRLLEEARKLGKKMISGTTMAIYQAEKQFQIYTGRKLPDNFIREMVGNGLH